MKFFIPTLCIGCVLFVNAHANETASDACDDKTTVGMTQCASDRFSASDKEMNNLYRALMRRLSNGAGDKLKASQRAWLKFRDAAVEYQTGWAGPCQGTLCAAEELEIKAELTKTRVEQLQAYVDCTGNGCPE